MHSKDDPLASARPPRKVTLWLEREGMLEARENFWRAYQASDALDEFRLSPAEAREVWDIAWAATVAAFDYLMAGRITPR